MVSQTERRSGEVSRVSGYGFQLNGEARWYNLSKFVKGLELPAVGESVEIALNKGYVVQITKRPARPPAPAARPAPAPSRPVRRLPEPPEEASEGDEDDLPFEPLLAEEAPFIDPRSLPFSEPLEEPFEDEPFEGGSPDVSEWDRASAAESAPAHAPGKDMQIVRMNAITNAVAILASGGRACEPEAVLQLAARLESWVYR